MQYFYHCSHRESLTPTQDLTETSGEESTDHPPHIDDGDSNHKSFFDTLIPESTEARLPSPSSSKLEVSCTTRGRYGQTAASSPDNSLVSASLQKSQPQDSHVAPLQDTKGAIRRAVLRSSRREVKADNGSCSLTKQPEEIQTEQESFRASQNNMKEDGESASDKETALLGYDAQWCWVESQDDVTFL